MEDSSLKSLALGMLVLSSGLLDNSWSKICELHESRPNQDSFLGIKIYTTEGKYTLVVFDAKSKYRDNSAFTLLESETKNPFPFLFSEKITSFSFHASAFSIFDSAYGRLTDLKSKLLESLKSKKPVIITGAGLGGSIASLFTLWLLETIDPKLKRPLCITFGSPLIGDASLQQILENSVRNSCFLHVADAAKTRINADIFKPFGTFLICFDSECISIEDPEAVTELLNGVDEDVVVNFGEVLHRLDRTMMSMTDSNLIPQDVINGMEKREKNKKLYVFDMDKKLKDMKISMTYMEWYKKKCRQAKIGYYDRFKTQIANPSSELDVKIKNDKLQLNDYWKLVVKGVEKKPQSDISILKRRYLFSGNNYRRMVEPLDIAEYYSDGGKEYRTSRSGHYEMLEKLFGMESIEKERCKKRDLKDLLTFDSCFWAKVEESLIVISLLEKNMVRREELTKELLVFEKYVWGLIQKREVSPEIFLEYSSFMRWWKEFKGLNLPSSHFTEYMNTGKYESYGQPILE